MSSEAEHSRAVAAETFATTRWTVVLAAGKRTTAESGRALEELCRTYWYPLYAYVRRRGHSHEDAEDSVQAFFERLLAKNYLAEAGANGGKFRAFLLASMKHFLANEWRRANRIKRGGGITPLPLDWESGDTRYTIDPPDHLSPDKLYDQAWAVTLLERVIGRLREENVKERKAEQFDRLKPFLTAGKGAMRYDEAAAALGLNEGTVRVAVHRLRRRYRELLRAEIAETLADAGQVEEELRALFGAFNA